MFSQRELFIQLMTTMIISPVAKSIPRDIRAKLLVVLRDNLCPDISNEEWSQIAKEINLNSELILDTFAKNLKKAQDSKNLMDDEMLLNLDRAVHDSVKDIDFDKLNLSDAPQEVIDWVKSKKEHM